MVNGQPGICDDAPQSTLPDLHVVRHDDAGVRLVAAQDHVTAGLAAE